MNVMPSLLINKSGQISSIASNPKTGFTAQGHLYSHIHCHVLQKTPIFPPKYFSHKTKLLCNAYFFHADTCVGLANIIFLASFPIDSPNKIIGIFPVIKFKPCNKKQVYCTWKADKMTSCES